MSTLDRALRKTLADTIIKAREVAEEAARDAVRRLGVMEDEPPAYLSAEQKALRVRLRAHARSLGDGWNSERRKLLTTQHLETETAYEIWHRMLFGRFLVERGLLIHPELGERIAALELADLAREEGETDPWALVERFAAPMLPAVFKPSDPVLAMKLDPALARRLREFVTNLPAELFKADDALGWTYQFWRASEKDAVNKAGGKVGADELPAVTQLFTERYMVQFLLHNTLGAWWAGKHLSENPDFAHDARDEQELRDACALPGIGWEYLRFVREGSDRPWRPAAGTFSGWPKHAAEITYCDPCCGSGHFLVEALSIFAAIRSAEEGLKPVDAVCAVVRENLHGLEIDGRCVQIATFAVALAAWRIADGPAILPNPQIAWVGAPPPLSRAELVGLACGDVTLQRAMEALHNQFAEAPTFGSLLEVSDRDLLNFDWRTRQEEALQALAVHARINEPEYADGAIAARGLFEAVQLLSRRYTLQTTNVPFLGRGKQDAKLADFIERRWPAAKPDLATAMLDRMRGMAAHSGTIAAVTPQNWLFLKGYKAFRQNFLRETTLSIVAGLGPHAFETITGEIVNVALVAIQNRSPSKGSTFAGFDVNAERNTFKKAEALQYGTPKIVFQDAQIANPSSAITSENLSRGKLLRDYASALSGCSAGDAPRFIRFFWEVQNFSDGTWRFHQGSPPRTSFFGGQSEVTFWENEKGAMQALAHSVRHLNHAAQNWLRGKPNWGKQGVVVSQMRDLPAALYTGEIYDCNCCAIVPNDENNLRALWTFCESGAFSAEVRKINQKLNVTPQALLDVPFNPDYWQSKADTRSNNALPDPYSDDPTQWLFHGHPAFAEGGTELHVALARLSGYRWPAETSSVRLSALARERIVLAGRLPGADADGLLAVHAIGGDRALPDRLRTLLGVAYGDPLTPAQEVELVRAADSKLDKKEARDQSLESWLRDRAFRQHCILFQQRPFLWHVWDGLHDGFSAFLHYHRLNHSTLEKLTFTILGDWIVKARAEGRTAHEDRARQLQQKLRAVLDGDAPFDIFARWKTLSEQPFGWRPDMDDGVRLNIRPFIAAEVLREQPRINWNKDRGTDLPSAPWYHLGLLYGGKEGDRINDHHLTLAQKRAVQSEAEAS